MPFWSRRRRRPHQKSRNRAKDQLSQLKRVKVTPASRNMATAARFERINLKEARNQKESSNSCAETWLMKSMSFAFFCCGVGWLFWLFWLFYSLSSVSDVNFRELNWYGPRYCSAALSPKNNPVYQKNDRHCAFDASGRMRWNYPPIGGAAQERKDKRRIGEILSHPQ